MSTAVFQAMTAKMRILLALSCVVFLSLAGVSQAQTAATQPPPKKVEELLKLLDDPEIKAWIAAKGAPPAAVEEDSVAPSASDFMQWSNAIRAHLRGIVQAIPAVPGEFAGARSTIMTEINGRRPGAILLLFAAFAALGFGAEFVFRRILARARRKMAVPAATEADTPKRHHVIGRSIFAAMAPLVVFALASIGAFLAFTWPPLLAMLVLPMLVALIAWRVIMRLAAIVLATDRRQADGGVIVARLIPMDDVQAAFWYRRVAWFTGIFFTGWAVAGWMTALNFTPQRQEPDCLHTRPWPFGGGAGNRLETPGSPRCIPGLPRQGVAAHTLSMRTLVVMGCRHEPGFLGRHLCHNPASDFEDNQHNRKVVLRRP